MFVLSILCLPFWGELLLHTDNQYKSIMYSGAPPWSCSSVLDHRWLPPVFESRRRHIWRLFRLSLRLITFGGRSAHLAYLVHKSGHKTSIIIIYNVQYYIVMLDLYVANMIILKVLFLVIFMWQSAYSVWWLLLYSHFCAHGTGRLNGNIFVNVFPRQQHNFLSVYRSVALLINISEDKQETNTCKNLKSII